MLWCFFFKVGLTPKSQHWKLLYFIGGFARRNTHIEYEVISFTVWKLLAWLHFRSEIQEERFITHSSKRLSQVHRNRSICKTCEIGKMLYIFIWNFDLPLSPHLPLIFLNWTNFYQNTCGCIYISVVKYYPDDFQR